MTRFFWLLSDGKTVRELATFEELQKQDRKARHVMTVHDNGDIYTSRKFVVRAQLNAVLEAAKK